MKILIGHPLLNTSRVTMCRQLQQQLDLKKWQIISQYNMLRKVKPGKVWAYQVTRMHWVRQDVSVIGVPWAIVNNKVLYIWSTCMFLK